jgi:ribosome recycling factor
MFEKQLKDDTKRRMDATYHVFEEDIKSIRSGRASPQLIEPLIANAYGGQMPLSQLATVSSQGPLTLMVQVWDQGLVPSVEKAILESPLGLNPMTAGTSIRLQFPELTEERRRELGKLVSQYGEKARVATRAVRRDILDQLKKAEKKKDISEDDLHRLTQEVQKMTDESIQRVDKMVSAKEAELMKI